MAKNIAKRIASTGWRVGVAPDGKIFFIGVRSDAGEDYDLFFITADSTPIITELLREMVVVHAALPPRTFHEGSGPTHPLSVPLTPLRTDVSRSGDKAVLALDFGGTVLKVAIDPDALKHSLARLDEDDTD